MRRNRARRSAPCAGIRPDDFYWEPTREEVLLDRLREMQATWDREDDARRRKRAREVAAEIEADRRKQMFAEAREQIKRERAAQLIGERDYWLKQRERDSAAMEKLIAKYTDELDGGWRKKVLAKIAEIEKDIRRDKAKEEREALLRRGVVRGRRR